VVRVTPQLLELIWRKVAVRLELPEAQPAVLLDDASDSLVATAVPGGRERKFQVQRSQV